MHGNMNVKLKLISYIDKGVPLLSNCHWNST